MNHLSDIWEGWVQSGRAVVTPSDVLVADKAGIAYRLLLTQPLAALVGNDSDHADVMSSAILGYN